MTFKKSGKMLSSKMMMQPAGVPAAAGTPASVTASTQSERERERERELY